ncbi:Protein kinase domain-containing protein [Heracleum sosnowskyi]|uniref:Protein kinase domain-containing protein n=1 Tax=Heracleum sosnowskyi TaxID=360622 RepID=A0AAD8HQ52_9APIA|nr:Protein kinase domain-containing protein [Heracleum sosnowskyi]
MACKWVKGKLLGKGTYGSVFVAKRAYSSLFASHFSPTQVAVKSAPRNQSWSLQQEKKILHELRGCPHIVHCFENDDFESIEDGTEYYNLVLEYDDSGSLGQLLRRDGCITEFEASLYAYMLLKGLSHVRKKGYVHCDIKPDNILIFDNIPKKYKGAVKYNLKIADFGLTKKAGERSYRVVGSENKHRGTLLYGSPESVVFGVHEAQMDIWALGCTVLEMIFGNGGLWSCSYDAQCLAQMIAYYYVDDRISFILPVFNNLSANARDFVARCLRRNFQDRWTADQLLQHPFITQNQIILQHIQAQSALGKLLIDIPFILSQIPLQLFIIFLSWFVTYNFLKMFS